VTSYNASVFQVVTANSYNIDFIDRASSDWNATNKDLWDGRTNLSNLSVSDIKATYDQAYVSRHADVVLWVIPLDTPIQPSGVRLWVQAIDERGWADATALDAHWAMSASDSRLMLRIVGAFAHPVTRSKLQMSFPFLPVVVI
jgi:hypothetical protein